VAAVPCRYRPRGRTMMCKRTAPRRVPSRRQLGCGVSAGVCFVPQSTGTATFFTAASTSDLRVSPLGRASAHSLPAEPRQAEEEELRARRLVAGAREGGLLSRLFVGVHGAGRGPGGEKRSDPSPIAPATKISMARSSSAQSTASPALSSMARPAAAVRSARTGSAHRGARLHPNGRHSDHPVLAP
jgi:hypothetical protein